VLVIAGDKDLLIPSESEARRLGRALPRCATRILPDRSHALLQVRAGCLLHDWAGQLQAQHPDRPDLRQARTWSPL